MVISYCFICFILYSFLGWLYESTICSIVAYKKIINRGFLLGPWCPIYGIIAVVGWLLLRNIENNIVVFILSIMLCDILEFSVSYFLEKKYNTRWWDYSNFKFNLQGRICLYSSLLFGILSLLVIKVIQPIIIKYFFRISPRQILMLSVFLFILFVFDLFYTLISMTEFNVKLQNKNIEIENEDKDFIYAVVARKNYLTKEFLNYSDKFSEWRKEKLGILKRLK